MARSHATANASAHELAQDLTQEVFIKCWLNRAKLATIDNISSYLFIVTRNQYINHCRKERREQISMSEYCRYYQQLYPPTDDPVQEREYQRLLEGAIESLPLRQQQVFIMGKELSMRRKEMARRLNMSELTVKEHLARAVKKIKGTMEE
jgi:RNA polymerase sigma factor (sigma-70 family)